MPKAKVSVFSETCPIIVYSGGMYGLVPMTLHVEWCVTCAPDASCSCSVDA